MFTYTWMCEGLSQLKNWLILHSAACSWTIANNFLPQFGASTCSGQWDPSPPPPPRPSQPTHALSSPSLLCVSWMLDYATSGAGLSVSVPYKPPNILRVCNYDSDLKIGTPVATLPDAWRYRVGTGTGRPGANILWLSEVESWICNLYLSVAASKLVCADPSLRYTNLLRGR